MLFLSICIYIYINIYTRVSIKNIYCMSWKVFFLNIFIIIDYICIYVGCTVFHSFCATSRAHCCCRLHCSIIKFTSCGRQLSQVALTLSPTPDSERL